MNQPLKYLFSPVILTAFAVSISLTVFAAEPAESRKRLCCGNSVATVRTQQTHQDVETSGVPKSAGWQFVCPNYIWMDWGNYQSYYASYKYPQWCTFDNFDTTGIVDTSGSCDDTTNCIGATMLTSLKAGGKPNAKSYPNDPGDKGYSGLKKSYYSGNWSEELTPADVTVEEIDHFVIKFSQKGNVTYAEVFIGTAKKGTKPKVVVARGLEINAPPESVEIRHDYSGNPGQDPLKPAAAGRSHALIYEYGVVCIPIILHHETPGN